MAIAATTVRTAAPEGWRLHRLSAAARNAAERAAREAGLSLAAWLARIIGEASAAQGIARPEPGPAVPRLAFPPPISPAAVPRAARRIAVRRHGESPRHGAPPSRAGRQLDLFAADLCDEPR